MMKNMAIALVTFIAGELSDNERFRLLVSLKGSSAIAANRGKKVTPSTKSTLGPIAMKIITSTKLQIIPALDLAR